MAKKVLNIEIGDQLVKVCVSTKRGKGAHALNSFCFDTPEMSVMDGEIIQPDLISQELEKEMKAHGVLDIKNVIFALSTSKVVSREVVFPLVKANKLKNMVMANAQDHFPVDLTGYQVAYTLLESVKGENAGHRVLISAVPIPILNSYKKMMDSAGLNLVAFDYDANCQYQIFKALPAVGVTMYVSVSTRQTLASFVKDGKLMLQRTFPFGGDGVVEAATMMSRVDELSFSDVLTKCADKEWLDSMLSEEEQSDTYSRLANGVLRSADYFKSSNDNEEVAKVVLLGTCANLSGLAAAIADAVEVDVLTLAQVAGVDKVVSGADATFYANCLGSLLEPLDLAPTSFVEIEKKSPSEESLKLPIVFAIVCVIAGAGLIAGTTMDYLEGKEELARTKERIKNLEAVTAEYEQYKEYSEIKYHLEVLEAEGISHNANLREFLDELENKLPSSIEYITISCDNFGISMDVEVPDMETAAVVISQLDAFETIEDVEVATISEEEDDSGNSVVKFSASCKYIVKEEIPMPESMLTETEEESVEPY